jgi:pyruvate dehydrogenase E2 component (dihydrolipoamide acetyltransferase)
VSAVTVAARTFRLPDLGEGLTEAEVITWLVAVGDTVDVDQVVVEVETAKAAVEVPVPFAGRVTELHAEPGQVLPVGQPLISVAPPGGAEPAGEPAEPASHAVYREEERAGSGNVLIGYGTDGTTGGRRRRRVRPAAPVSEPQQREAVRVISPIVRRLARERGVDLGALAGTGPGGVIRRSDVEAVAQPPAVAPPPAEGEQRTPMRGLRRAVAEQVSRSRREIPEVTIWVDVDATGLLEARAALKDAHPDRPVSLLALLARNAVSGLRRFPQLNSRLDVERQEIVQPAAVHLGIAAQTDRGLVVPVLHDADRLTTLQLADALADTTEQARAGTLPPARLTGGTFTLNNYGVFGVDGSTPIINHPESALLGIGRVVDKPWAVAGQLAVRKVAQVSLTFDHRICDGDVAGGFLRYVADCIERPVVLLGDV